MAVISGLTYNFLPFMVLPLYVALEKIDPRLIEAADGPLRQSRLQAFLRVTLPLSMPGVFAGSLLTFIPAVGDFINAEILGQPRHDDDRATSSSACSSTTTPTRRPPRSASC